jgi:hypothetical protein
MSSAKPLNPALAPAPLTANQEKERKKHLAEVQQKMAGPVINAKRNPLFSKCQPIKDKALCNRLTIAQVKEYADLCHVNKQGKSKEQLCTELAVAYGQLQKEDDDINTNLRKDLNRVYFNMYFSDKAAKAGWIRKFFWGDEIAKLDKQKKDFIDLFASVYTAIDSGIAAENRYNLVDALYHYGQSVSKMLDLIDQDKNIRVESRFKDARQDLIRQLNSMIHEYTIKLVSLTSLLKEGEHSPAYMKYLKENNFDAHSFHEFTLYGNDIYAKIVAVYDADTVTAVLQVNNNFYKWNIRMYGYDGYEMKSKHPEKKNRAVVGRQVLFDLVKDQVVIIRALPNNDKYGRLLANIYIYRSEVSPEFDLHPRYPTIITGLKDDESDDKHPQIPEIPESFMQSPACSSSNKIPVKKRANPNEIPIGEFKTALCAFALPEREDLIYVNQLMLDLGVGIPYFGDKKKL